MTSFDLVIAKSALKMKENKHWEIILLSVLNNQLKFNRRQTPHDVRGLPAVTRKHPFQLKRISVESTLWNEQAGKEQSFNT